MATASSATVAVEVPMRRAPFLLAQAAAPHLRAARKLIVGGGELCPQYLQSVLASLAQPNRPALDELGVDQRDAREVVGRGRAAVDALEEEMQSFFLQQKDGRFDIPVHADAGWGAWHRYRCAAGQCL